MEAIEREIRKKLRCKYKNVAKANEEVQQDMESAIEDVVAGCVDEIMNFITEQTIELNKNIESRLSVAPEKIRQQYIVRQWLKAKKGTWADIAKACCINGNNKNMIVQRKFQTRAACNQYRVDEIDMQRLKKIGIDLY